MSAKRWLIRSLELVTILAVVALIAGQMLGQPILLSYVTSGSMEPTIDTGDGFVAVPAAVSGPVEPGDVVVFQAEAVNDGQLTTHRVVEETEQGFITRGDANPFTDQANNEPPVKRPQIVAKALQVNGNVVVIPHLGTAFEGIQSIVETVQRRLAVMLGTGALLGAQGLAYLVFALSIIVYAVDAYRDSGKKGRERSRSRDTAVDTRLIAAGFALVVVFSATAAMAVPSGPQEYGVVSADFESDRPTVIESGTSKNTTLPISNGGVLPAVVFLEPGSDGIEVTPRETRIRGRSTVNATVTLTAPPETGFYRRFLVQHRYLALLPQSTISALHEIHPWLPIVAIDALLGIPFYLLGVTLLGTGRLRERSREGPSKLDRLLSRYT
jgi:signal peptidase